MADAPQPTLEGWGDDRSTSKTSIDGDATFDLKGRRGAAVLVWITDLGEAQLDARSTRCASLA